MSDTSDLLDLLKADFASALGSNSDAKTAVDSMFSKIIEVDKMLDAGTAVVDAAASHTQAERVIAVAPYAAKVKVYYTPYAGLTGHDTDYVTWTFSKYTAAGATKTTVASATSKLTGGLGTLVAFVKKQITASVVAAATTVEAGAAITVATAKAGSGVAVPAGKYQVVFEPV